MPAPKPLTERVAQKSQPRPATATKATKSANTNTNKGDRGRPARGRKGRNPGRGKPKTVEELDAEMVDYFANENVPVAGNAPVNGTAPQATNGGEDLGMAEISVSSCSCLDTSPASR